MGLEIKKILVPIDFSQNSKEALRYSVNFSRKFKAKLILIYVIEPMIFPPDFSMGQIALPTVNIEVDKKAQSELKKLAKKEIHSTIKYDTIIKTGKPFIEIIDTAKEENADLIIIASHGHSGVESILFGSTADKVVSKSPCPVLSLRVPVKGFDFKKVKKKERN